MHEKNVQKTVLTKKCFRIFCCCWWDFDDLTIQLVSVFLLNSLIHAWLPFKHLILVKSNFSESSYLQTKIFLKQLRFFLSYYKPKSHISFSKHFSINYCQRLSFLHANWKRAKGRSKIMYVLGIRLRDHLKVIMLRDFLNGVYT